ncbi:hypothetical protein F5B20DRAFT_47305 [Whalleya microplaca]|nr:hypothetical protein F5B20DRAFT_47305 [Whalleya microplaca]
MAALQKPEPSLLGIPVKLRLKIFETLFTDLIEDLPDNLFAVFEIYDCIYDHTANYVGRDGRRCRSGLTPILSTCKQIHTEALPVLFEHAEIVVSVTCANNQRRGDIRFPGSCRYFGYARHLKVNFLFDQPGIDWHPDRALDDYVRLLNKFLGVIENGRNLRSLQIYIDIDGETGRPSTDELVREATDVILNTLAALRLPGKSIQVYNGMSEFLLSEERLSLLLDAIKGVKMRCSPRDPLRPTWRKKD